MRPSFTCISTRELPTLLGLNLNLDNSALAAGVAAIGGVQTDDVSVARLRAFN